MCMNVEASNYLRGENTLRRNSCFEAVQKSRYGMFVNGN